jgi:hypothetical protein
MTDPEQTPGITPETAYEPVEVPAPLQGCLYCHAEGTTTLAEGRKILGLGSGLPVLACSACGSVARFEPGSGAGDWRIRYRKVNRDPRYYYVMVYMGRSGWLDADEALRISRQGYAQRQRVAQTERGDLSWLTPIALDPPPPLMSPEETVYLTANPATFQQSTRGGVVLARDEENILDTGILYVTDWKVHLLGRRRDWSHKLADIQRVEHTDRYWRLHVGASQQHYQGLNQPDQIDAQLFSAVVHALMAWQQA